MTGARFAIAFALWLAAPQQQWTHTFDAEIAAVSIEPRGACFAVMTGTELAVLDDRGAVRWKHDIRSIRRWMPWGGAVAVSEQCDWAVIAGTPDYHYVWVLERSGRRHFVSFGRETPVGVAISPDGTRFAVSTGASKLHLFERRGQRLKLVPRASFARDLAYTPDGDILPATSYGAQRFTADGALLWKDDSGLFCESYAQPRDGSSVSVCQPNHGPGPTHVTARTRDGRELWSKVLDQEAAVPAYSQSRFILERDGRTLRVRIR